METVASETLVETLRFILANENLEHIRSIHVKLQNIYIYEMEVQQTCAGLIIFVSGSSRDSRQWDKYPAILGMANKTGKNSVGKPIALIKNNEKLLERR